MKANSSQSEPTSQDSNASQAPNDEWNASDPVWKLLDKASPPETDVFFARNVVRATRQMEQSRPSIGERLAHFFSPPKLALGAAACACCAALVWQMGPFTHAPVENPVAHVQAPVENTAPSDTATVTDLSELVMVDTLSAAAEDPTIFTRDEVVTMLGL